MAKGRICRVCGQENSRNDLDRNLSICVHCGNYMRFHAIKRINSIVDTKSFKRWCINENSNKNSDYIDSVYEQTLNDTRAKYGINEAIVIGEAKISGVQIAIGVMDTRFLMASMGHYVGECVTVLFERAKRKRLPVVMFCCSGGARMQEGIISLMQMEKTAAAVRRYKEIGEVYISVLTNPTMGGVTASFATMADIVIGEKGAKIGFAGPRVIEQNTGVKLPKEFQTAEFQMQHGFLDSVLERRELKDYITCMLKFHNRKKYKYSKYRRNSTRENIQAIETDQCKNAWEKVLLARSNERPTSLDFINCIFDDFNQMYGDRVLEDDHAIVAGIAQFNGFPVTVIGQEKGKKSIEEAIYYNWGMASPSGYRKVLRMVGQAEKFKRPIICFVDTIGAACGMRAEEQGQGNVIAQVLEEMSAITVPVLSIIISEGGSGGALALAVGNEVWMLQNSIYSVLTPEGYASILWKDNFRASEVAEIMKLQATDLYDMGVIDKIICEKNPVNCANMDAVCQDLKVLIDDFLYRYSQKNGQKIADERYMRYRKY